MRGRMDEAKQELSQPKQTLWRGPFRLWATGSLISAAGDQFFLVALPWLILEHTSSAGVLGGVMTAAAIPRAVLMLLGGAVTDRFSPRRIMMITATCRALLVGGLAALIGVGWLHLWQLYALCFCFGTADAFAAPASQAFLPVLVEKEQLTAANSVMESLTQGMTLVAPAPAGWLIKGFGVLWAFVVDAVSFVAILIALVRLPDAGSLKGPSSTEAAGPATRKESTMLGSILKGLQAVQADRPLFAFLVLVAVLNFCIEGPLLIGLALLAKNNFHSSTSYGVLMSTMAVGSLVGMALAGLWRLPRLGYGLLAICVLIGITLGAMGLLGSMTGLVVDILVMMVGSGYINVQLMAWFQKRVEREVMGRVMSVLMFAVVGLMPFSMALAGVLGGWSLHGMFLIAGAMVVLTTVLSGLSRDVRAIA